MVMNELIFSRHTNLLGHLMGGQLMYWMDVVSALSAYKHAQRQVVTVSVDNISFKVPVRLGNLVHLEAQVARAFSTSMEVFIRVRGEDLRTGERFESNKAYFTFVALDQNQRPAQIPLILPQSEEEKERYDAATQRRALRLRLAQTPGKAIDDMLVHFSEQDK